MTDLALAAFLSIVASVLGVILALLILWLIIRGAVLSALRQYRREGNSDRLE